MDRTFADIIDQISDESLPRTLREHVPSTSKEAYDDMIFSGTAQINNVSE